MMMHGLWILLLKGLVLSSAEVFEHEMSSEIGFAFLGKFSFGTSEDGKPVGTIHVQLQVDFPMSSLPPLDILLYDDEDDGWPMVYDRGFKNMSCADMRRHAKNWNKDADYIKDPVHESIDLGTARSINWTMHITEKSRDRFWYVALANCMPFTGIHARAEFLNILAEPWDQQFPVDEQGLEDLFVGQAAFFFVLVVCHIHSLVKIWQKEHYIHSVLKLLSLALLLEFASVVVHTGHFLIFARNGTGLPRLGKFADVLELVATTTMMFLLLLLAQGWTITTTRLTGRRPILVSCAAFLATKLILFFWTTFEEDDASIRWPFFYVICSYLVTLAWIAFVVPFCSLLYSSWKGEGDGPKSTLFARLGLVFGPWLFGVPLTVLLSLDVVPWRREITVRSVHLVLSDVAYGFLVWLFWHSRVAEYFDTSVPVVTYDRVASLALADCVDYEDGL